ncbi:MAG: prepilin-type N-terminal cleavage/methylation domain-containing protein [Deltaproteobacteria bacterium]|nr:prepilin-type N-terminal cleavage/methylation domain-containing protein [Deltaproteobacteria bacterium]
MKTKVRKERARGFSLIEVLMASAILPTGLAGVLYLLGQTALVSRDADLSMQAAGFGSQLVEEYEAMGYEGLVAQTVTGLTRDRLTGTVVVLVDPVIQQTTITATVTWNDSHGRVMTREFHGLASKPPDP